MLTNEGKKEFIVFCYSRNIYFSKLSFCSFEVSCVRQTFKFGAFFGLQSQKKEFCIVSCILFKNRECLICDFNLKFFWCVKNRLESMIETFYST